MTRKKTLFIIDTISKLDPAFDSSLGLLREFFARGHETWAADAADLRAENRQVLALASKVRPLPRFRYALSKPQAKALSAFNLVLIRKEPPFDETYLTMLYLLEQAPSGVFLSNSPDGIRRTHEKLSILHFKKWMPKTVVSASPSAILAFQGRIKADLIAKPLGLKGGEGIALLKHRGRGNKALLREATSKGCRHIIAQEFLRAPKIQRDKRILILNGNFLAAYEKHCAPGEFRANLSLGGTCHPCDLTSKERQMISEMRPYLRAHGIHLAGIDVINGKLLEVNVTCPAGLMEAEQLYPRTELVKAWADFLERKVRRS